MQHSANQFHELTEDQDLHDTVADYRHIVLNSVPILDVRAPCEFAQGALANAVNLPLLTDAERQKVGLAYREGGQTVAINKGLDLLSLEKRQKRLDTWIRFVKDNPNALICCWRGGLRSKIVQTWLAESGWMVPRIVGGTKALRTYCMSILKESENRRFVVLAGRTGSRKTSIINELQPSIDLEGLAHHRGSAFGGDITAQPAIINFESHLARDLLEIPQESHTLIEDESRVIGKLAVPDTLFGKMGRSPVVVVNVKESERVKHIYASYVKDTTETAMLSSLFKIRRRLGNVRYDEISTNLRHAFSTQNFDDHATWLTLLLRYYYDPMYDYQLERKRDRIVFQGDLKAVLKYLGTHMGFKPR